MEVLRARGTVWLGIRTCSLSSNLIGQVASQVERLVPSFLFLMQRSGDSFNTYKSEIAALANDLPQSMLALTPEYYATQGLLAGMQSWIKVTTIGRASDTEIERLAMYTTGTPLVHVFKTSMLSFGAICCEPDTPQSTLDSSTTKRDSFRMR